MLFSFQCTSDNNRCAFSQLSSNNTDNVHGDDTLTPADLMTFAWQIAKGMVRAALRAECRVRPICLYFVLQSIKYFRSRAICLNASRGQIFPSYNWGISEDIPHFQSCARCVKDLKDNKDNSLHLGRKYARIFVLGHYLFLVAHYSKQNVRGQISYHIFAQMEAIVYILR